MDKKQYIKKRKSKKKDSPKDYSFYISRLPNIQRRFRKETVVVLLIILTSWLLWFAIYIYYPLITMVDIEGKVADSGLYSSAGRSAGFRIFAVKLDNYVCSIRHEEITSILNWNKTHLEKIQIGDTVTIQIRKKDFEKLNNCTETKPLSEYSKSEISKHPRFYGIKRQNEVIVSSPKALWYAPSGLGILFQIICFSLTLIAITDRCYKGKELYEINQWIKSNT
jgi:hypothetical protein